MTLYVESNFVIEIALGQEQSVAAEPFTTITQRGRVRQRINGQLNDQIKELTRSRPHQQEAAILRTIPAMLTSIEQKEVDLLVSTVDRLLRVGRLIGFDGNIFGRAVGYRARFGLSVQDAIMLAAAVSDLEMMDSNERSYFASKNWRDFDDPGIRRELLDRNCLFVSDFGRLLTLIGSGI